MLVICDKAEKCKLLKDYCDHGEPHEVFVWNENEYDADEGPDCTHFGKCDTITVRCVPVLEKKELDFEIEDLFIL